LAVRGSGAMVAEIDGPGAGEIGGSFDYSDGNVITVTRAGGGANYNAVRTYGTVATVPTTSEVTDAADVALRGKVYYPTLWGSREITLARANAEAAEFLTAALRGKLSVEIPLNPFLEPGMRIAYDSTRLNLSGTARIFAVQHQYAVGRARTYLRDLQVVP